MKTTTSVGILLLLTSIFYGGIFVAFSFSGQPFRECKDSTFILLFGIPIIAFYWFAGTILINNPKFVRYCSEGGSLVISISLVLFQMLSNMPLFENSECYRNFIPFSIIIFILNLLISAIVLPVYIFKCISLENIGDCCSIVCSCIIPLFPRRNDQPVTQEDVYLYPNEPENIKNREV